MNLKITSGTSIGYHHTDTYSNNQDSFCIRTFGNGFEEQAGVFVVCDGCSSSKKAEVGANLFARILPAIIMGASWRNSYIVNTRFFNEIEHEISSYMKLLTVNMDFTERETFLADAFMFTIVFALITPVKTYLISCGDGVFVIDGKEVINIDQNNTPTYIAYNEISFNPPIAKSKFVVNKELKNNQYESIIVASDGLNYLLDNEGKELQMGRIVPSMQEMLNKDKYFTNKTLLQRHLQMYSKERILFDDTTMIMIKKDEDNSTKEK